MQELFQEIQTLKNSEIKTRINTRLTEFSVIKTKSIEEIFKELCFCIMTANCSAMKCIEIHEHIGEEFLYLSKIELARMKESTFF